jgi:glycosyltransferase involved in cell wall biosynthesis
MTDGHEGLLAEPRNATSIALAIVRLLSDDALKRRVAEQGLKTAAHYAWPSVAKRVLQTYDAARERSLVSGRRDSY